MYAQFIINEPINQLEKLELNVPLLFLYPLVGKPDKHHWYIVEVQYPQPVACRRYKLKRAVDPKLNLVAHHMLLMLYPNMHFLY